MTESTPTQHSPQHEDIVRYDTRVHEETEEQVCILCCYSIFRRNERREKLNSQGSHDPYDQPITMSASRDSIVFALKLKKKNNRSWLTLTRYTQKAAQIGMTTRTTSLDQYTAHHHLLLVVRQKISHNEHYFRSWETDRDHFFTKNVRNHFQRQLQGTAQIYMTPFRGCCRSPDTHT